MLLKQKTHRSEALRKSARGETCTLILPGICNLNPETTVWAHSPFRGDGKSMGSKSHDFCGCYACSSCHDALDGRVPHDFERSWLRMQFLEAMKNSLIQAWQKGVKIW
jgi:hypothetical protein